MSTGVGCAVFIDGVRAADGSPGESADEPAILEDLHVTWGRSDTMSQPAPDTCTFSVLDPIGGAAFMEQYRTGKRVDVVAHGSTTQIPPTPTFVNPGFETAVVTWAATGGTAARTSVRFRSGANALQVQATPMGGGPVTLWLAPAAFQPAGTNPDAWDAIPTTEVGQTWSTTIALWLPAGASASIRQALYTGPYATAGAAAGTATVVNGDGAWHTYTIPQDVQTADRWLGFQVVYNPTGPAWDDMPPALAWDGIDASLAWDEMGTLYVDEAQATSPAGSSGSVLVFSGRITDLSASWDNTLGCPVAEVTASGFTADLDNRTVGDEPWPVESVDARAHRILTLAGLPIDIDIDTSIDTIPLSWRDVDSQGATGLLQEIAVSVDGVLWPAVHQALGAYLRLEDPALRVSLLELTDQAGPPPVVQRTNLFTNPVPASITGFSAVNGATVAYDAPNGGIHVTCISGPTDMGVSMGFWARTIGVAYTVSIEVQAIKATRCHVDIQGIGATRVRGTVVNLSPGQVVRLSATVTPTTATGGAWYVLRDTATATDEFIVRKVLIEKAATALPYFDGSTPDTPTADYAWTGAVNASTSTQSTVQTHTIVIVQTDPEYGWDLSACLILRDPVTWLQDVTDVVTRTSVGWKVQGVDDEGNPTTTDATENAVDAALEVDYGTRRVSVSTQLQAATDAQDVAQRILSRTSPLGWRASGLTIDDDDVTGSPQGIQLLLDLLDGTSRIGAPLTIGDLPIWSPAGASAGVYLEGGTYRFIGGRWVLELGVSASTGLGESAAWDELDPSWQWDWWSPDITWNDLRGVSA